MVAYSGEEQNIRESSKLAWLNDYEKSKLS